MDAEATRTELQADDLRAAIATTVETLTPALEADWSVPAGSLEWSCRQTLDHLPSALLFYAGHLATRARERRGAVRSPDPNATPAALLWAAEAAAAVLADVVRTAPPDARGFHP